METIGLIIGPAIVTALVLGGLYAFAEVVMWLQTHSVRDTYRRGKERMRREELGLPRIYTQQELDAQIRERDLRWARSEEQNQAHRLLLQLQAEKEAREQWRRTKGRLLSKRYRRKRDLPPMHNGNGNGL